MSKKCGDHKKFYCEQETSRSSKSQESSSKRKRSKCHKKTLRCRESSSKNSEKSKQSYKARVEHLEPENTENESSVSNKKESSKSCREGIDSEKKKKKKKRKKKCDSGKKRKLSGSSECPRLIEHLIKSCFCLEGLDSSSSSSPPYDVTSFCCCKCRFCRPDCDSKSIQCNDCDRLVTASLRDADNLCDSGNIGNADLTSREVGKPLEYVTREKCSVAPKKSENELLSDLPKCESEEKVNGSNCNKNTKSETGITSGIVKSFTALKDFRNCRCSPKSFSTATRVKTTSDSCNKYKSPNRISPQQKIGIRIRNPKNCSISRRSRCDDRSSSSNALLIMFDIVFWPHTCFPR